MIYCHKHKWASNKDQTHCPGCVKNYRIPKTSKTVSDVIDSISIQPFKFRLKFGKKLPLKQKRAVRKIFNKIQLTPEFQGAFHKVFTDSLGLGQLNQKAGL